jgi:hypothetical protein
VEALRTSESRARLGQALEKMIRALDMLDEVSAPAEISGYLDLAISRLQGVLGVEPAHGLLQILWELEDQLAIEPTRAAPMPAVWEDRSD